MSDIRENVTSKLAALTIFKPVPGGYVYCAPDRVFGPSRCYLVNEAQKAEIIALTTPRRPILWQVMLWLVFTLFVLATVLIMWAVTGHDDPTPADGLLIVLMVIVEAAVGLVLLRSRTLHRLRPVLADLSPTNERITPSDVQQIMKADADSATNKQLVLRGAIGIAASVAFIANFILQLTVGHGQLWIALLWLAGAILFGITAAGVFTRVISRSKAG
jgi:hypothetical protein